MQFLALALFGLASPLVYQLTTVAGSDLVGDGGQAVAAQIAQPEGIVIDSSGSLYIADAANHRIRRVTPDGVISTIAGNGHGGFSGDNGPADAAQLNQPYGLALDTAGNLYVADYGNQRVRRIAADGTITTLAAALSGPRNLAWDLAGNLYVSEFDGHRVRRVAPDGTLATIAGMGIAGSGGDGGPATGAQLAFPAGLAFDGAGNLYIVDSLNVRIRKVQAGTGIISTLCTQQSFGMPYIRLSGIAASSTGNLYIPESGSSGVWKLTPTGDLSSVATETALNSPVEVALNAAGDLYISEARQVRCVAVNSGTVNTVAGSGVFGFSGDGGGASLAVLNTPAGLALGNGGLYIADRNNQRVRRLSADGAMATVAGDGSRSYAGDGLPAISAALNSPAGVAFDSAGNLYIADAYNDRVRRVDGSGVITSFAGNGTADGFGGEGDPATLTPLAAPQGVAADTEGNTYIADTNHDRVIRVDATGNVHTAAGTGTPGDLYEPTGLALDSNGNLYIADTQNHRVRMLGTDGVLSTVAGTGTGGFGGDDGPATAAQLTLPAAVAVDSSGNLYIADTGNNRVRMVSTDGVITTIAGTGDGLYNGDQGLALQMALYNPAGLAVDGQGNVWVADTGNNRVRLLSVLQTDVTPPKRIDITVANSASLLPGPLAPGEIFSIFGAGIGPETAMTGTYDKTSMLSTSLGTVQVLFDNTLAPLFYVGSQQINAQVPYEIAGRSSAQLQVVYQGATIAVKQVSLAEASPALFTLTYGNGNAVVVNQDGSINDHQHPAPRGSIVVLYATGEGQTEAPGVTGEASQAPYPQPALPVMLYMGAIPANILFAGEAPGFVGLMQINAQVPSGFVPTGDLPLVLQVGSHQSPSSVTIAVE